MKFSTSNKILTMPWQCFNRAILLPVALLLTACGGAAISPPSLDSPRLLYLAPDESGAEQLFSVDPAGGDAVQVTRAELGLLDYRPSPDGETIAFAARRSDGGSDVWAVNSGGGAARHLLACPGEVCAGPVWTPDGQRLVIERGPIPNGAEPPGAPRLWWLDPATGDTAPVFADAHAAYGAGWSADGAWFSWVSPDTQSVTARRAEDGRQVTALSRAGGRAAWHPQLARFLVTDFQTVNGRQVVHLFNVEPAAGKITDISGAAVVEDVSPDWGPDGAWVAFTRKAAGASMGRQVWLMRSDGSEARALTGDSRIHYALPRWSPDGRTLAVQRTALHSATPQPSIWLLDVDSGTARQLIPVGNRPTWLPGK